MRRRTFLSALPVGVLAANTAQAQQPTPTTAPPAPARPADPYAGVGIGDRISGPKFMGRSTVWGANGAAATAHPAASLIGIDTLRRGGSAIDAAIAINAALGFLEPVANGIGGDAYCMLWDPKQKKVVGLNGSGASPRGLSLQTARSRAIDGYLPRYGAVTVNVPGAVDAWWSAHQRYGKLPWKEVLLPVAELCEQGAPVPQVIAYYLERNMAAFDRGQIPIEENDNRKRIWAAGGATPKVGELFANPYLGKTLRLIAEGGRDAFYDGPLADQMEAYFKRIGGWMTRADLAAHHTEWVEPIQTNYRGVDVFGLGPNTQGLSTNQILNICEQFDLKSMGFQSAASLHVQAEAKRLAFEDRARWFADDRFSKTPVEWLNSKAYAAERAILIRPDRVMDRVMPGDAPHHGRAQGRRALDGVRRHGRRHAAAGPGPDHHQHGRLWAGAPGGGRRSALAALWLVRTDRPAAGRDRRPASGKRRARGDQGPAARHGLDPGRTGRRLRRLSERDETDEPRRPLDLWRGDRDAQGRHRPGLLKAGRRDGPR